MNAKKRFFYVILALLLTFSSNTVLAGEILIKENPSLNIELNAKEIDGVIFKDGKYYLGEKILIMPNEENSGSVGYSNNSNQQGYSTYGWAIIKFTYYLSIDWDLYENFGFKIYDITAYVTGNERISNVKGNWEIYDYHDGTSIDSDSFYGNIGSKYSGYVDVGRFTCPLDTIKVSLSTDNVQAYVLNGHGWVNCNLGYDTTFDTDE